jgi:hypothetical protein
MRPKLFLASALLLGCVVQIALSQNGTSNHDGSKELPVVFARMLNTEAVTYKVHHNSYPSWEQLVAAEKEHKQSKPGIDFASSEPLAGFNVRWNLSADGSHYDFLLQEKKQCGMNVVSNEVAVIYRATALGCD